MVATVAAGIPLPLFLALALLPGTALAAGGPGEPEPDSLADLTARVCGLVQPSAELAAAAAALPETAGQAEPRQRLKRRLAVLAREVDKVCRLYTTEGEELFLGQEISAIYPPASR